jgi:hypothetical protein
MRANTVDSEFQLVLTNSVRFLLTRTFGNWGAHAERWSPTFDWSSTR